MRPTSRYTPGIGWHDPDVGLAWYVSYKYVLCGRTDREILDALVWNFGDCLIEIGENVPVGGELPK